MHSSLRAITAQKMKFSIKFPADLVTFAEGILNQKLHFLCSVYLLSNFLIVAYQ